MFTFMIIMYIDKIMISHSHDREYELSFINEPKKSNRDDSKDLQEEPQSEISIEDKK